MTALELLAPAKNLECGIAAIDHGADAVYIGASRFGARVAAGNSVEDIERLCRYAHQYGAKVYVTVNTLVFPSEREEVRRLLQQLARIAVDAVLVQDMQLLSLADGLPLVLHASTQADNRTAEKVEWLSGQGFRRAVLARELTLGEIAAIHQRVPQMELEVFVHGALCVSYSGLCYASEYCFNRSANRGACAQFCRMKFDLLDADGRELVHQRHLLSLKDLNLSAHLGKLIEAGAVSFKIEGRLKDSTYVKNVTAAYSQLLDRYIAAHPGQYRRASLGRCRYTFQPDLDRTFNRGYTTYFINGRQPGMASFYTPKAIGQCVGKVKELRSRSFTVAGTASFANGDGLCFFDADRQLVGFRVNRVEGNHLFPASIPTGLSAGTPLFRSSDQAMERELSKSSAERRIPVTMSIAAVDEDGFCGFQLTMDDGQSSRTVRFPADHQQAKTPQRDNIARELAKLGNTPYLCTEVIIPSDFSYFIPASQLAAARRELTSESSLECREESSSSLERRIESLEFATAPETRAEANSQFSVLSSQLPRAEANSQFSVLSSQLSSPPLMQCRYCLRHELGVCLKYPGKSSSLPSGEVGRGPLFLRLADGRRFRLEFDCRQCQMNVYADEE
jgi:putative protease